MRFVITGALGQIGSRLIRDLPAAFPDAEIVMVDDLSSRSHCSLLDLPLGGRYRFIKADVVTADLAPIIAGARAVIHLAAITSRSGGASEARMDEVNFTGTERVAMACSRVGAPLVFISTTSVYSGFGDMVDETSTGRNLVPQNAYAHSKLEAERVLNALAASEGLLHATFRFGTVFGPSPGMQFDTAINKFCRQAVSGMPMTVWRTALHQQRPYLDIDDAVAALLFVLRKGLFHGDVLNVVTVNSTVSDVVKVILQHVAGARVDYVDVPGMNELSYDVDRSRIESIGFAFTGSLENGIRETVRRLSATRGSANFQSPHEGK